MSRLDDPGVRANNPFWSDGARARAFSLLRRRVEQVPAALKYCHRVLGGIHAQFYPLAVVPSRLEDLCRFFAQPSELRRVINHQIHAGARVTLGLVHSMVWILLKLCGDLWVAGTSRWMVTTLQLIVLQAV